MTSGERRTFSSPDTRRVTVSDGVYAPQHDSRLVIAALTKLEVAGRRVADLCTGSGVVAITAARREPASVTGFDVCPRAIACTRANTAAAMLVVH